MQHTLLSVRHLPVAAFQASWAEWLRLIFIFNRLHGGWRQNNVINSSKNMQNTTLTTNTPQVSPESWWESQALKRVTTAWTYLVFIQLALLTALAWVYNASHEGILSAMYIFLQPVSWFCFVVVAAVSAGILALHFKTLTPFPRVYKSRWDFLCHAFTPHIWARVFFHALLNVILLRCYLSMLGPSYSQLSVQCPDFPENYCLNRGTILWTFAGLVLGLYLGTSSQLSSDGILAVPSIAEPFYQATRSRLGAMAKQAWRILIVLLPAMCVFYWLFGTQWEVKLVRLMNITREDNASVFRPMLRGLVPLFMVTWINRLALLFLNLQLCQPTTFPIEKNEADSTPSLSAAITSPNPLLALQAAQDLVRIAKFSPAKRQQLFSLSIPGGHPRNWNNLTLRSIVPILESYRQDLSGEKPVKEAPKPLDLLQSPGSTRLRALHGSFQSVPPTSPSRSSPQPPKPHNIFEAVALKFQQKTHEFREYWLQRPAVKWLWGESADHGKRLAWARSLLAMNLAEGLAVLIAASFVEDTYGVVQKDLPALLTLFLELNKALEQSGKLSVGPRRPGKGMVAPELQLGLAFKAAVKAALFRITVTFKETLTGVSLSSEYRHMLRAFEFPRY